MPKTKNIKLFKFHAYMSRSSDLEGLFLRDFGDVSELIGTEVYFGEIAGKHSEVFFVIEEDHITEMPVTQETVLDFVELCGEEGTVCGVNPFDYAECAELG